MIKLLILGATLMFLSCLPTQAEELVIDKNEIKVYVSKLAESDVKRFRGVTIVNAGLTELTALLHDLDFASDWIHALSSVEQIAPYSDDYQHYTTYSIINAPWPTKDRDNVVYNTTEQDPISLVVTLKMESKSNLIPEAKKYVRIPSFSGYWKLEPLSSHSTQVTFSALSDPGGSVPLFIYNGMIEEAPYETLLNLKQLIPLDEKYASAKYHYINNVKQENKTNEFE